MPIPLRRSSAERTSPFWMVSAQPVMAVRGVRSSWETEEMNSLWVFSACPILRDISLMASVSSPISSSYCFSIWTP